HPRRRTKVLRVGEKTSKKAKLCFMQHLKVTFNRIKADIFSRFTTSNTSFFVLLFGLRLMQQPLLAAFFSACKLLKTDLILLLQKNIKM
ncbi:MAG: hypothetical protein IJN68_04260, partial [Clostridia bacterium]|nr:hypothetical protein [Clostridia bacterium]